MFSLEKYMTYMHT